MDSKSRLCLNANEIIHYFVTDCEVTTLIQLGKMTKKIPLPDMTWSVKDINICIHHPAIHKLMMHKINDMEREIEYIDRKNHQTTAVCEL